MDKKDMTGVLFVNDKGDNEARPDHQGDITINGVTYRLAGWNKVGAKAGTFISLAVSVPVKKESAPVQKDTPKAKRGPGRPRKDDPFDDDE